MDNTWTSVYVADGKLAAEMIKLTLESFGIEVMLAQESVGGVYGLTVGPLGETSILVSTEKESAAREILQAMEAGSLEASSSDEGDDASQGLPMESPESD